VANRPMAGCSRPGSGGTVAGMMATQTATSVLVVDDEPQVVWMLRFSLEAEGYQTLSARDGASALAEIREHHPRLMLLDVMMPIMDGWTVLEHLQAMPESDRPKVIVVSARASLRDKAKAIELGADAFVAKPFSVDDLLEKLRELDAAA
jgi:CheY-like chemotaxis protein